MPTLLIAFGIRFFFYMDEHKPVHVHISYGGKKAKIELMPTVKVIYNHGIKDHVIKKALNTCNNYRDEFINSSLKFEIKAKQFYAASQRVL